MMMLNKILSVMQCIHEHRGYSYHAFIFTSPFFQHLITCEKWWWFLDDKNITHASSLWIYINYHFYRWALFFLYYNQAELDLIGNLIYYSKSKLENLNQFFQRCFVFRWMENVSFNNLTSNKLTKTLQPKCSSWFYLLAVS